MDAPHKNNIERRYFFVACRLTLVVCRPNGRAALYRLINHFTISGHRDLPPLSTMSVDIQQPTDVLDLLFDDADGLINQEVDAYTKMNDTSDLLAEFVKESFGGDLVGSATLLPPLDGSVDHDYAKQIPSPASDSGISTHSVSSMHSWTPSIHDVTLSMYASSVSPSQSGSYLCGSPSSSDSQSNIDMSPLNADFENQNLDLDDFGGLSAFNFDTLDANSLLTQDPRMDNNTNPDTNITIDLSHDEDSMDISTISSGRLDSKEPKSKTNKIDETLPFTMKDVKQNTHKIPDLLLTDEEKELLTKDGYTLPADLPLTREEERALRTVRRKIRNKVSAKKSRKNKDEYVHGLEERVKSCTKQNNQLTKKVGSLEKTNQTLLTQLKRLQAMIMPNLNRSTGTNTCCMVLVFSFALFILPSYNPFKQTPVVRESYIPGRNSRSLLTIDEYEISVKPGPPWEDPPKTPAIVLPSHLHTSAADHAPVQYTDSKDNHSSDIENSSHETMNDHNESTENHRSTAESSNDSSSAVNGNGPGGEAANTNKVNNNRDL